MIVTSMKDHRRAMLEHKAVLRADGKDRLKFFSEDTGEEICYHWEWPDIRHLAPEDVREKMDALYERTGPPIGATTEPINTFYED